MPAAVIQLSLRHSYSADYYRYPHSTPVTPINLAPAAEAEGVLVPAGSVVLIFAVILRAMQIPYKGPRPLEKRSIDLDYTLCRLDWVIQ